MLAEGDRVPDVTVWTAPNEQAKLPEVLAGAPALVFFYLFDLSAHLNERDGASCVTGARS